ERNLRKVQLFHYVLTFQMESVTALLIPLLDITQVFNNLVANSQLHHRIWKFFLALGILLASF
ncbi:hypothetical protein, partial [Vibrio parahaemolyticus]|uniref:hypothetical protein n=1 Tax=Vibrio parahaemolyticus TaxID=670 RepID=UPI001C5E11D5